MSFLLLNLYFWSKFLLSSLFTTIFRPEMLKFHPYSILTGNAMVGFLIFCVLRSIRPLVPHRFWSDTEIWFRFAVLHTKMNHVSQSDHYCCMEQFLEIYHLTNHLLTMLISFQLTSPILLKYSKKQFSTKPPEQTKGLDGGRCSKAWEKL